MNAINGHADFRSALHRRGFLTASAGAAAALAFRTAEAHGANRQPVRKKALVAISLDLEMSAQYPRREMTEWNYKKGNLDQATKDYSIKAARIVKDRGGLIHFFCVGRVLEQPNVDWLKEIAAAGHPIGNHTYHHVAVKATDPEQTQFRFQRAPWLVEGLSARQIIERNIKLATLAMKTRLGIPPNGFRTPGGFTNGLDDRPDIQKLLLDLGFKWVSSRYPAHATGNPREEPTPDVYESIVKAQKDAQPYVYPSGLIEVPCSPISDVTAFRSTYWKLDSFLKAIRMGLEWAIQTGSVFDFLAHPSCLVVEDPNLESLKLVCDIVNQSRDRAAIVGLDAIANSVKEAR
jgi:peptidoglycan/xylan/chitin deacetylase (PgdA/CDA1 family)